MPEVQSEVTGAVLAGAGARGGFEAGFLAGTLPSLERQGRRPRILCGSSAGAINATLLAAFAHLPAEDAALELVRQWSEGLGGPLLRSLALAYPMSVVRWAAGRLGLPLPSVSREVLGRFDGWDDLHRNVREGLVDVLALCAADVAADQTVVFVETREGRRLPPDDDERGIRYVRTEIGLEHVLASSDVPLVLVPTHIADGPAGGAWYVDGGLRLNVPLKPAIDLGADRLVVVSTDPASRPMAPTSSGAPTALDVADLAVHVITGDRVIEDLHTMTQVNLLLSETAAPPPTNTAGRKYQKLPALVGTPESADDFARLVVAALEDTPARPLVALGRLTSSVIGLPGSAGADLLSFALFLGEFTRRTVQLGQERAAAVLGEPAAGWRQ